MKKKVNIVLLLFVLGLWGTVLYKYVSNYFRSTNYELASNKDQNFTSFTIQEKDSFNLVPLDRDPFLNKGYVVRTRTVSTSKPRFLAPQIKEIQPKVSQPFPRIQYYGYIKSGDKKGEVALLHVNGNLVKMQINEIKNDIQIISLNKDSVKVGFNKQIKWFGIK